MGISPRRVNALTTVADCGPIAACRSRTERSSTRVTHLPTPAHAAAVLSRPTSGVGACSSLFHGKLRKINTIARLGGQTL